MIAHFLGVVRRQNKAITLEEAAIPPPPRQLLPKKSKRGIMLLYLQRVSERTPAPGTLFTRKGHRHMNAPAKFNWDGVERRKPNSCRRVTDRRSNQERRSDPRAGVAVSRRGFYGWLRSIIRIRLGVDRRKTPDQRVANRRQFTPRSMLTREELADLLR